MSTRKRTFRNAAIGVALAALVVMFTACEEPFTPSSPIDPPEPPQPPVEPPQPPQPPATTVVVQDPVTVIPPTTTVAAVTADTVSFAAAAQHAAGDVLVFNQTPATPNGLLRKVTAVSADRRTFTTEQATLEDVIESGTVKIGGSLKPSALTPASRAMLADMGIVEAPLQIASDGTVFDFNWNFPSVAFSREIDGETVNLYLDGNIALSLSYTLEGHYDGNVMSRAKFTVTPRERVNLRLSVQVPLGDENTRFLPDASTKLFNPPLRFGTIVFPAGPVPVLVQPQFNVSIGVSTVGKLTVDVVQEGSVTFGMECPNPNPSLADLLWESPTTIIVGELAPCGRRSNWRRTFEDDDFNFGVNEVSLGAEVRAWVSPQLSLKLYDAVGPYGSMSAYARAGVNRNLFRRATRTWVKAGVNGAVGIAAEVPILGWSLGNITLATTKLLPEWEIWSVEHGAPLSFGEASIENQVYTVGTAIQPFSLPAATGGTPFECAPGVPQSCVEGLRYTVSGLPPGLQFDRHPDRRALSGKPEQAVTNRTVTYEVRDAENATDTITFRITVNAATPPRFVDHKATEMDGRERDLREGLTYTVGTAIEPLVLPAATGGRPFTCSTDDRDCKPGLRYSLQVRDVAGVVPLQIVGLQFDPYTRTLSGTPNATVSNGSASYQVTDADGKKDTITFRITVGSAPTGGKMYWTNRTTRTISRANLDGSGHETLISTSDPTEIEIAGGKMYWTDSQRASTISRANLDGSGRETLIRGVYSFGMAITGGKLYWANRYGGMVEIERANLDGSDRETLIRTASPYGIAISGGKMYWTAWFNHRIERANLDGSGRETLIGTASRVPRRIAIVDGKMYWTTSLTTTGVVQEIERANLDGSGRETLIRTGNPYGIAISGGKMYWTDLFNHRIERANLDGSGRETLISAGRRFRPFAIAIAP